MLEMEAGATLPNNLQLVVVVLGVIPCGGGGRGAIVAAGHMNWSDIGWGVGVWVLIEWVVSECGAVWGNGSRPPLHSGRKDYGVAYDRLWIGATGSWAARLVSQVTLYHEGAQKDNYLMQEQQWLYLLWYHRRNTQEFFCALLVGWFCGKKSYFKKQLVYWIVSIQNLTNKTSPQKRCVFLRQQSTINVSDCRVLCRSLAGSRKHKMQDLTQVHSTGRGFQYTGTGLGRALLLCWIIFLKWFIMRKLTSVASTSQLGSWTWGIKNCNRNFLSSDATNNFNVKKHNQMISFKFRLRNQLRMVTNLMCADYTCIQQLTVCDRSQPSPYTTAQLNLGQCNTWHRKTKWCATRTDTQSQRQTRWGERQLHQEYLLLG